MTDIRKLTETNRFTGWQQNVCLKIIPAILTFGCTSYTSPINETVDENATHKNGLVSSVIQQNSMPPKAVAAFCGDCHAFPQPATFPNAAWFDEVEQGYRFYRESGRSDLDVPSMKNVVAWYRANAPESLHISLPLDDDRRSTVDFVRADFLLPETETVAGVSHLMWPRNSKPRPSLIVSDMFANTIRKVEFGGRVIASQRFPGTANYAAHAEEFLLKDNPSPRLIVAGLGSSEPADHKKGSVELISADTKPTTLLDGVSRVADVRAADFDSDGYTDLVVAEFGWRKTGSILLMKGTSNPEKFEKRILDSRHGAIHVPTVDIDRDGDVDIVALISQEHEQVVAFINSGNAQFQPQVIFDAGDPSFGSTGIQLVDLDGDDDIDVLYTNGDTLDSFVVKPYHGVRWLENQGTYPFVSHTLVQTPGVARALAADLDSDGDLDVATCVYLAERLVKGQNAEVDRMPSTLWLEQTPQGFRTHILEVGVCKHMAMEIGDFDNDGRPDIATGHNSATDSEPQRNWITVWWNEGPEQRQ